MSGANHFKIIQRQYQSICRMIQEAEKATDVGRAEQLYCKAKEQMDDVTASVKEGLSRISVHKAA